MGARPTRRTIILAVAAAYLVALGATVALARPWDGSPSHAEMVARRQDDEAAALRGGKTGAKATSSHPGAGAAPSRGAPGREIVGDGDGATPRPARRVLPRATASPDPPAPALPVPPAPAAQLVVPLGRCCSESRAGAPVDAIVLHATESRDRPGPSDLLDLARYFRRAGLASHVADNARGSSMRLVGDDRLAYHATFWNDVSVGIEQVGFSSFTRAQWLARPAQLTTTARWVAFWARRYRIPIRRCAATGLRYDRNDRVSAGTMVRRGVCSHAQLDPRNRDDPGGGYPWDVVLARARAIANRTPSSG